MVKSEITISHQFHIRRTQRKCIRIVILSYNNLQYGPGFFLSDGSFSSIQTLDYSDVVKYICLLFLILSHHYVKESRAE